VETGTGGKGSAVFSYFRENIDAFYKFVCSVTAVHHGLVMAHKNSCMQSVANKAFSKIVLFGNKFSCTIGFTVCMVYFPAFNYFAAGILTFLLTLCGLTRQKTHWGGGGLRLGGLVHEEAYPCFPYFVQPPFKRIDVGSTNCPLVQLILSINYSV